MFIRMKSSIAAEKCLVGEKLVDSPSREFEDIRLDSEAWTKEKNMKVDKFTCCLGSKSLRQNDFKLASVS